ncbi:MAG: DNA sulfur modification protein DndD [Leptospiraceae bacterium]|nr:DNA sulfur modification protein DndD [Leptospiraceae bacterium]MCP5493609.1 DNA sulfur modification protein DndD [Leptospiraceae bacterium]
MIFKKIVIENYKSFRFPLEVHFPHGENEKSIFLIGGMNGAGKSSLMESINICLYGARKEDIYKAINRSELSKGNSLVSFELIFETEEKNEIIVKRSWKASAGNQGIRARDLNEKLIVTQDGKLISVQNKEMWQDYINSTIPRGITQFFFFDGEKIQEIAADEHSEVRLKSSLEEVLGIRYISQLTQDILYIKQEERKGFVEITDADIDLREKELTVLQSKLEKKKEEKKEIEQELTGFTKLFEEAKKRFQAAFHIEPESKEDMKLKERKKLQASSKLTQIEYDIKNLCEQFLPYALAAPLFPKLKKQIEIEQKHLRSETLAESAEDLANRIVQIVDKPTPIYEIPLDDLQKEQLFARIIGLLKKEPTEESEKSFLNLSEKEIGKILVKIEQVEGSHIFNLQELLAEKEELEKEMAELESYFHKGFSTESEKELFYQLQAEMESCSAQTGRLREQLRLLDEEILRDENKIKEKELEISKFYERHDLSKEKTKFIKECDSLYNLLGKFVIKLRKSKITLLQEKILEMYKLLSTKNQNTKELVVNENTYEITIKDMNSHVVKKSTLSAGEKEVFAISLLWGLARTSELDLPIIIDTPLSRLDSKHRNNIIHNYFPNAGKQIIILSTDTEVDKSYYKVLEPYLSGAAKLLFEPSLETSVIEEGYFWN